MNDSLTWQAQSTQGLIDSQALKAPWTVLYFYPRDNTPGCTTESQDFAALHDAFLAKGAQIIGVSRDSMKSHQNFSSKFSLPFALISDPEEQLCQLFDVMRQKNMYGKQVRGIERSTFILDAQGKVRQAWRKVKIEGHAQIVLEALDALQAQQESSDA